MNPVELAIALLLFVLSLINGAVEQTMWTPTPVPAETGAQDVPVASGAILDAPTVYRIAIEVSNDAQFAGAITQIALGCESGGQTRAVGKAGERGVTQVHPVHRPLIRSLGLTWDAMFQPRPNLTVAWAVYQAQGLRAWSGCLWALGRG